VATGKETLCDVILRKPKEEGRRENKGNMRLKGAISQLKNERRQH